MDIPPQLVLISYSLITLTIFAVTSSLHQFRCP
jgi:hypothetical protein